jgi:glyoxylase-like metal-dependent hydrolase (beta-lactamase superfamily II)
MHLSGVEGGMRAMGIVQCYLLDTGYCLAWEHHVIQGGARRRIACHALVALLQHPRYGWLLWDAGYAPRLLTATQSLPYALYRLATPLHLDPKLTVTAQLGRWQLTPADIGYVLVSHFHADHIAGLRDFPTATFVATQEAYADIAPRHGFNALRRGFIPTLLPEDFSRRLRQLPRFTGAALPGLGATYDLFNDGSLLLVELPGHARGQMGMLAQTQRGPLLFAADGCWLLRAIRENRPPSRMTHFFIDDAVAMRATVAHLHTFSQARPDVTIIPSHCPEVFAREVMQQ